METYNKRPITIAEQMAILKNRELQFNNEQEAVKCLKIISYFRLANYWKPMESDKFNHVFKSKSSFENVLSLYNFDKDLRTLIFSYMESIEIALRTKLIQIISSSYGAFWFAKESLFRNYSVFIKCLTNITDELKRSKEDFIVEHFIKYDNPSFPPS